MNNPSTTAVSYAGFPQVLKATPRWLVWKLEPGKDGKPTKAPYSAKTGCKTDAHEVRMTFEDASAAADDISYNGVGFVPDPDFVGIDFDGVVHDDVVEPFVLAMLEMLGNPYTEFSPSGTGLHAFVDAKLPEGCKVKISAGDHYGVEFRPRYLTMTGRTGKFSGTGVPKIADFSLAHTLISQIGDEKFKRLWLNDSSDYKDNASDADLAFCNMLVKVFGNDPETIDQAFRASKRYRLKWDERHSGDGKTYGAVTLAKALKALKASTQITSQELEFHLPAVTVTSANFHDFVIEPLDAKHRDGWFPLSTVSLVGGSSGSNKTTWMMPLLQTQLYKQPVLGHATNGRPYLVLMADRGEGSHYRTMERLHLDPDVIPIKFLPVLTGLAALQNIVNLIEATTLLPQVVFLEGCDMLVDDANKKQIVAPFMEGLRKVAEHFHIAIIGSVGAPKTKMGEGYIAKRDNISGTEAWGRLAETVVLLQYPKGKDTAAERELTVMPRNAASESFDLIIDNGVLRLQTEEDHIRIEADDNKEILWVQTQARLAETDPQKKWWTILDIARGLASSYSTADRWVRDAHAKDILVQKPGRTGGRGKAGQFRWNDTKTNPLESLEDREGNSSESSIFEDEEFNSEVVN